MSFEQKEPKTLDDWKAVAIQLKNIADSNKADVDRLQLEVNQLRGNQQNQSSVIDFAEAIRKLNKKSARYKAPIPTFSGRENEDIDSWIFLIEQMFTLDEVRAAEQVVIAGGYLRDLALESFRQWTILDRMLTWKTLKDNLLVRFRPYNFQSGLRNQLELCKQDNTFSQY